MKFRYSLIKEMITQKMEKTGLSRNNYELSEFVVDYEYEKIFLYFTHKTFPEHHIFWHQRDYIRFNDYQDYEKIKDREWKIEWERRKLEEKNNKENKKEEEQEEAKASSM